MTLIQLCIYIIWVLSFFELMPSVSSFTDADFAQLQVKVRAIEANQVSQDKKFAAILSSIAANIAQNSNSVANVKIDLQVLRNKYDKALVEVAGVKNRLLTVSKDIVDMEEVQNSTSWNISLIESHLTSMDRTLTHNQMSLNSSLLKMRSKVYHELPSEITNLKSVVYKNHNESEEKFSQLASVVSSVQAEINSSNIRSLTVIENLTLTAQNVSNNMNVHLHNVEERQNKFAVSLRRLEENLQDLSSALLNISLSVNIGANSKDQDVGFQVNALEPIQETSWDTPLNFSEVAFNTGDGWNQKSSAFKAPVSGTYLFWATITSVNSTYTTVSLRKLGIAVAKSVSTGGRLYHTSTLVYSLGLNVGEFAWFQIEETTKVLGQGQSSFGGTLLFRH